MSQAGTLDRRRVHTDPLVARAQEYADDVLRPTALATDQHGVGSGRVRELRELGLLNHLASERFGGRSASREVDRALHEIIAAGCLNTWLVWAQHGPLSGRIAVQHTDPGTAPPPPLFERVLRGEILLGAGVSDVRRYPDHYVRATRTDDGWRFDGTISWVSGWGLSAALTVAAVEPSTSTVVTALVEVGEHTLATPLDLGAVRGSRTERVELRGAQVPDAHVLGTQSFERWAHDDLGVASDARAHHFGLGRAVLDELEESPDPGARAVAATWRPRIEDVRRRAYALADEAAASGGGAHRLDERLATKVESGEALSSVARALLVSRSGRGLAANDTAQLHFRNASFLLVQGQTGDVRAAQLRHLAR